MRCASACGTALGWPEPVKAAHAHIGPSRDEGGGGLGRHELGLVGGVLNAGGKGMSKNSGAVMRLGPT